MKQNEHRSRLALTLLFAAIVFGTFIVVAAILVGVGMLLLKTGMLSELSAQPFQSPVIILLLIVISLAIGGGISMVISKITMKPVNRFINAMQELAQGNFSVRLNMGRVLGKHPTIKELTDCFNKTAEELGHTEILRSDFINNFSHEFKTPIVSIAGFAKLLKRDNLTEEQRAEYVDIIEEESLRLSAMATNVLNLTKIENQTILTEINRFNLSEQIRNCILILEEKWSQKQIVLKLDFGEYYIDANEEMLKQVWLNLLDNAIKFANIGGEVGIEITQTNQMILVSVSNTGSSIAPEERTRIFNKFYQSDESHSAEGNGIGLAIVKEIIQLHRGNIHVSGDKGITVFTVTLSI